jgi:rubrerythrin
MMGPVEALKLALSKEEEAITIYKKFSMDFSALKETFSFLINEEEKHKLLLEKKIAEATK